MAISHTKKIVAVTFLLAAASLSLAAYSADDSEKLLPGPENYRPEPDSVVLGSSVALQWQLFENANLFRVQAAYSKKFTDLFLDDTSIYHYYRLNDLPQDGTQLFWRVRACNLIEGEEASLPENLECVSEWSKAYSFYSGPRDETAEEDEEETNFFRRVLGCNPSEYFGDGLLPMLADLLPFGISILIISKLHRSRRNK